MSLAGILAAFGSKLLGCFHTYIIIENESQHELVIRYKRQTCSCFGGSGVSLSGSAITLGVRPWPPQHCMWSLTLAGQSLYGGMIIMLACMQDHEPDVVEVLLHPRGTGKLPAARSSKLCELAPCGSAHIELFWPTGSGIHYDPTGGLSGHMQHLSMHVEGCSLDTYKDLVDACVRGMQLSMDDRVQQPLCMTTSHSVTWPRACRVGAALGHHHRAA